MNTRWLSIMKKFLLFLIIFLFLLSGCAQQESTQIAATTLPVWEFTTALCENTDITVTRLVTENVSCLHDYSLRVSQMQAVESCDAVVLSGAGLEEFMEDVLQNANHVIDASKSIDLSCEHSHGEHNHAHDPHIWLSPANAKQMCQTICSGLSALYPSHKAQFETNLNNLIKRLDALQAYGEDSLKDLSSRNLITFHDGFTYFAASFDLQILKAVEEESGSEASAKELVELIETVKNHDLQAIFTEVNGSTSAAEIIASETGVKVYALDMAIAGEGYFDAMYRNIDTIKEALQ